LLKACRIGEVTKKLQVLKKLEEAKILSMSWRSLKNRANWDLPKNLEEAKKIEELKNLRYSERTLTWLRQPVGYDGVGLNAWKNVEESKKLEVWKLELLKILAENLEELKIPRPRINSRSSQARCPWSAEPKHIRSDASDPGSRRRSRPGTSGPGAQ
jgi:hypothetical protein